MKRQTMNRLGGGDAKTLTVCDDEAGSPEVDIQYELSRPKSYFLQFISIIVLPYYVLSIFVLVTVLKSKGHPSYN